MVDQKIVPHGITPLIVTRSEKPHLVGRLEHTVVTATVRSREGSLLPDKGDHGHEPHAAIPGTKPEDRLGRRQVEPHGHAAQKEAAAHRTKPLEHRRQLRIARAVVGTVAGERNAIIHAFEHHVAKDTPLARTLQPHPPYSTKKQRTMKNTGIVIGALVGGMLIGSALTMLLTPQSGPELRRKIKESLGDEIDRVKEKLNQVEEQIEEARCRCNGE